MFFKNCIKDRNWRRVRLLVLFFTAAFIILSQVAWAEKQPTCSKCGRTIYGEYYQLGDKNFCQADLPRCIICGRKVTDRFYTRADGKFICEKDYKANAPVCSNCHKPILVGKYMRLRDKLYSCEKCEKAGLPRCFICNLPISNGGLVFSDGRRLCAFHSASAVNDQNSAQIYFRKAKALIAKYISSSVNIDDVNVTIHIVDQKVLAEKMRSEYEQEPSLKLTCGKTLEYGVGNKKIYRIYILQGLPSEDFLTTMIHECGHVWQLSHKVRRLGLRHQEGFCEWLTYKINKQLRRATQISLLENKNDSIYHAGLLNYLDMEAKQGKDGVLRSALGY